MPRVRKTVLAENDLDEIWFHIALDNSEAADALLDTIDKQSTSLVRNPRLGRARPELLEELRSFPVGNYVLFYRPMDDGIEIVRVLHGARDLPNQFSEPEPGR